jgi:nicotinamidase-related amidase
MEALLLIDIQNDYFEGGAMRLSGSEEAAENARQVLEYFRLNHQPVIHIRHIAMRPGATFFLPDTPGAEIFTAVRPLSGERVIIKHYPNSFRETGLQEQLQSAGCKDLVVCGMMTHMCVDATVRAAKDLGYTVTLIGDACATKDLEYAGRHIHAADVHGAFLAALDGTYARVIPRSAFLQ